MKNALMFLILSVSTILFSAQFEIVKDVYEETNSITAQQYGYKDVNGDFVAILKVKTDIEDLAFKSMTLDKSEYMGNGIYHVYMQPGSRMLEFMKTGFISVKHQFPKQLESNKVYVVEIKGVGEEKKIENIIITIQTVPSGGEIYFDGENLGFIEQIETGVGSHEIKIKRNGYKEKTTKIEVSAKNNFFKIELDPVLETIKKEPEEDFTGSGMTFSIETGIPFAHTFENEYYYNDSTMIEVNPLPGIGFSINSIDKINDKFDVFLKTRAMIFYEPLVSPTSPLPPLSYFFEGAQLNIHSGICYHLPFNTGIFVEAGIAKIYLRYQYKGEDDDHQYDSWDFSLSFGLNFTYKRYDLKIYNDAVFNKTDVFKYIGLSVGYKFWLF